MHLYFPPSRMIRHIYSMGLYVNVFVFPYRPIIVDLYIFIISYRRKLQLPVGEGRVYTNIIYYIGRVWLVGVGVKTENV